MPDVVGALLLGVLAFMALLTFLGTWMRRRDRRDCSCGLPQGYDLFQHDAEGRTYMRNGAADLVRVGDHAVPALGSTHLPSPRLAWSNGWLKYCKHGAWYSWSARDAHGIYWPLRTVLPYGVSLYAAKGTIRFEKRLSTIPPLTPDKIVAYISETLERSAREMSGFVPQFLTRPPHEEERD